MRTEDRLFIDSLMSFSINFYGGALLIMMDHNTRSESLFYYFRIEDHVPEDHLLRLVDRHIDFAFVRETLKVSYSHTGRPSIDPEILLRILLIGYLYGITSERRLVEDVALLPSTCGRETMLSEKNSVSIAHRRIPRIGSASSVLCPACAMQTWMALQVSTCICRRQHWKARLL